MVLSGTLLIVLGVYVSCIMSLWSCDSGFCGFCMGNLIRPFSVYWLWQLCLVADKMRRKGMKFLIKLALASLLVHYLLFLLSMFVSCNKLVTVSQWFCSFCIQKSIQPFSIRGLWTLRLVAEKMRKKGMKFLIGPTLGLFGTYHIVLGVYASCNMLVTL